MTDSDLRVVAVDWSGNKNKAEAKKTFGSRKPVPTK